MRIRPIGTKAAAQWIRTHHRHHLPSAGCKFALALHDGDRCCGVAVAGRPVNRHLDDGLTLEVLRVATDGTPNACSELYGAVVRVAWAMGYDRLITYTLPEEGGASLRGAGWACDGETKGGRWARADRLPLLALMGVEASTDGVKSRWIKRRG